MEEINKIYNLVTGLTNVVKNIEDRLGKNEQLVVGVFSYLYSKTEDYNNDLGKIKKDLENNFEYYNKELSYLKNELKSIQSIHVEENSVEIPVQKQKIVRKRPWHYFISKYFKYKKLIKEKRLFEEQLELSKQLQLKELEKKRLKEQQENAKRQKLIEEERKRKQQEVMNIILSRLK